MKNIFTVFLLLFLANTAISQELDFKLLDKLTKISFVSVDDYMINGYGFEKLENKSDGTKRIYARYYGNDFDNTIIITVLSPKDTPNVLDIDVAKNYNIRKIKDELLSRGYEYSGTNKYGLTVFKKEKSTFLIGDKPNEAGATQIMVITEW